MTSCTASWVSNSSESCLDPSGQRQILVYIAEDQPDNAERFVDCLIERGDSLGTQPQRGRMVPEYQDKIIREVFEDDYRIIYKIRSERVDILTVRHSSQLLPVNVEQL